MRIAVVVSASFVRIREIRARHQLAAAGLLLAAPLCALLLATGLQDARGATGPQNTAAPTITGTPEAGQTLDATSGTWTGSGLIAYAYQWQSCDATGAGCVPLAGGTSASFTLGSGAVNHTIRVVVSAKDSTGTAAAMSAPTGIVVPAPVGAPDLVSPPTITGPANVNGSITALPGTWGGVAPITYAYAWQRCDPNGGTCSPIPGAAASAYTIVDADAGSTLRVSVTATNASGSASATSVPTALVPGTPTGITVLPGGGKSVDIAGLALPNQLVISKVTFTPTQLSSRNPFTLKVLVHDLRGYAVQGALVYALGVPYSRIGTVAEQPTAADGTVTLVLHPLSGLSLGRGQYLVVFLRVRKPGDPINGGVSVRQLVQIRTGPSA